MRAWRGVTLLCVPRAPSSRQLAISASRAARPLSAPRACEAVMAQQCGTQSVVELSAHAPVAVAGGRTGRLRGIVFDMDGTLTNAGAIDFGRMRARCGVPPGEDIIAFVERQSEARRLELARIIVEEEEEGLRRMSFRHGASDTLRLLTARQLHRAILTRNNDDIMMRTLALLEYDAEEAVSGGSAAPDASPLTHPAFSLLLSRSFTPVKPHPAPIHHICAQWGCEPNQVIMVGDTIDDVACGRAAGAHTVLIGTPGEPHFDH
ncbi:HAD family hydrolase, partial [archaeon]